MNPCRKTQQKCTIVELNWKVGGKLEGKGTRANGGDLHFRAMKYSESCGWVNV